MRHWLNKKALYMFATALLLATLALGAAPGQPAFAKPLNPPSPPPGCHYVFLLGVANFRLPPFVCPPPPPEASITLTVINPPAGAWTAVQWSVPGGTTWYNVATWVGPLDQAQYGWMPHWVDRKDYGSGPFRWVVYDKDPSQGGGIWAVSDPFYFPTRDGQMVWTQVTPPVAPSK